MTIIRETLSTPEALCTQSAVTDAIADIHKQMTETRDNEIRRRLRDVPERLWHAVTVVTWVEHPPRYVIDRDARSNAATYWLEEVWGLALDCTATERDRILELRSEFCHVPLLADSATYGEWARLGGWHQLRIDPQDVDQ